MTSYLKSKKAFSILEIMIFVTILSIVLLAMTGFTIRLIFNMKINEHKIRANFYAEEAREWLNGEREIDWNAFRSRSYVYTGTVTSLLSNASAQRYCLNSAITGASSFPATTVSGTGCPFGALSPPIYKRELFLFRTSAGSNQVRAVIRVSWMEGTQMYTDIIDTIYTQW